MSMEGSRVLVALGLAVYCLSMAATAFVPAIAAPRAPPSAAMPGASAAAPGGEVGSGSAGAALLAVAVGVASGMAASMRRSSIRSSATQRHADASLLSPSGPVPVYCEALVQAAAQKDETVQVTKDIMKLKKSYDEDEDFLHELLAQNTPGFTQVDLANLIIEQSQPLESTVLPKFLVYLAKKKRMMSLKKIMQQYVQTLYISQSIAPVTVITASPLTDDQKEKIKEKMKAKLGVDAIKLVCEFDQSLLGGFKLQYGYTDPDRLKVPTYETDITLKSYINNAAVKEGVVA